jgi:ribose transport system ATP-binding protein/inositol transport system ATP-binding protein
MSIENLIEFRNIKKTFPGVVALKDVSFEIKKGEVHALVGENGAGKSTLIKILSGVEQKDDGRIFVDGRETSIKNPKDAFNVGITSIYQELPLAPSLSIADNIFLGQEIKKFGFLSKSEQNRIAKKSFKDFDMDINPKTTVEKLSVSMQQITAIIKSMMKEAKVFIMDEPTATLGEHEVEMLFDFIAKIKKKNISVLYISHRMDEIFGIADRVTVLKDGNYMGTKQVSNITKSDLITMMSGKNIHDASLVYDPDRQVGDKIVLDVRNLKYKSLLKDINFSVRKGEIFGITGLVGAGKTELLKCIYGLYDIDEGEVVLISRKNAEAENIRNKRLHHSSRFGFVPEDRKREGLFLNLNLIYNISISSLNYLTRLLYINKKKEIGLVTKNIKELDIKTSSVGQQVQFLSGGNQQKVILSRWLSSKKRVLLLDEPTRGIDVMAKTEIYKLMNKLSREGISLIFSTSDVSEVLSISDRVAAMRNGRIIETFERKDFDKEKVLHDILID